ncbi:MAG: beta-galactosidase, partial [Victivallales bacterium]|nr:beta-galactosidase [Victivallales bacterium]
MKYTGTDARLSSNKGIVLFSKTYGATAFYQDKLSHDVSEIQQVEVSFMSRIPGYIGFGSIAVQEDGSRKNFGAPIQSVMTDGEYHTYIFDLSKNLIHTGKMSNWELRFYSHQHGEVGLRSIEAKTMENRIADAEYMVPGRPNRVLQLMPRSRCVLRWEGVEAAKTTVRFYDRDMKELPDTAVVLTQGQTQLDFTTPEMMIYATATIDAKGQGVPVVRQIFYQRPFTAAKLDWRGKWIWSHKGSGPDEFNMWFQKEIMLEDEPEYAAIAVLGDDFVYTYVNGKFHGKHKGWRNSAFYDVTKSLRKGKNLVTVRIHNLNQGAGLVLDGYVRMKNGKDVLFETDDSWGCNDKSNTDTSIPADYPKKAIVLGEPATLSPWKKSIGIEYAGPRGKLIPIKMQQGKMTVKVAEMPKHDISKMRFRLEKANGENRTLELSITPASDKWEPDKDITIEYPFPHVEGGAFKLFVDDYFVAVEGNVPIASVPARKEQLPGLKQARLVQNNGRPYLQFGEDRLNGAFWLVLSSLKHEPELAVSKSNGFTNLRINSGFSQFWKEENQYDFSDFDFAVDRMLSFTPDAIFSLILEVDMPEWWCQAHPEEASAHYGGNPRAHLEREKQGLASKRWIQDAKAPLNALIEHISQRSYADHIWGISFASGCNWEWFWMNRDANFHTSWSGYSPADMATFRRYMKEKYGNDAALAKAWNMPGLTFETMQFPDWRRYYNGTVGI